MVNWLRGKAEKNKKKIIKNIDTVTGASNTIISLKWKDVKSML